MNTDPPTGESRFLSLTEAKQAHAGLRKRFSVALKEDDGGASMADEIERFVARGSETGTILAESDERWSCQTILDYWLTKLFDLGRDEVDATLAEFDPETAPELPDELCPYMGLDAFNEDDASLFVGRRHLIKKLAEKLGDSGLLMVTGSSGSGKSSVVMAGLIPALKSGALPGSEGWRYCHPIVPGNHPMANLEQVTETGGEGAVLAVIIDQFEEVFTLCDDPEERDEFGQRLVDLADRGDRIIFTMRTDLESYLVKLPMLETRLKEAKIAVPPLSAADLRRAIEEPAQKIGLRFEDGVIDRLVEDLVGEPAGLPLLQFTLMMLWKNRSRNRITLDAYETLGGGRLALERTASRVFEEFIPEEQRTAKRIFMKLVTPGEGKEFLRKRITMDELYSGGEAAERVDRVLERLTDAQLVRKIEGDAGDQIQLEVVHEALVRNWQTLGDWLDDARQAIRHLIKMSNAAEVWHRAGKDENFLYRGDQLVYTEQKIRDADYDPSPREREFILACQDLREAEIRKAKHARMIHWAWTVAVTVLSIFALWKWYDAHRLSEALENQKLAKPWLDNGIRFDDRGERFEADLVTSAYIDAFPVGEQGRSREILNRTGFYPVWQSPLQRHHGGAILAISASKDGSLLASGGDRGEVKIWDVETGAVQVLRGHVGSITSVALSPDGQFLASAGEDKTVRLWRVEGGVPVGQPLRGNSEMVVSLAFGPNGEQFATGEAYGLVKLWKMGAGRDPAPINQWARSFDGEIADLAFSPDGRNIAVGGSTYPDELGAISILDTAGKSPAIVASQESPVTAVVFGTSADRFFAGDKEGRVRQWKLGMESLTEESIEPAIASEGEVTSLVFSADRSVLAISDAGGTVNLWDWATQSATSRSSFSSEHLGGGLSLAFAAGGRSLFSGGGDGVIKRWDPERGEEVDGPLAGRQADVGVVAMSPDGRVLAAGGAAGKIDLWDLATGEKFAPSPFLDGHVSGVTRLAFSPKGKILVSGGDDGRIKVWDWRLGAGEKLIRTIEAADLNAGAVSGLEFTPDGSQLISMSAGRVVCSWDVQTGEGSILPIGDGGKVTCSTISPDGGALAFGDDSGLIRIWDLDTRVERQVMVGQNAAVTSLVFSPDGTLLASGGADNSAIVWRVSDQLPLRKFSDHPGPVSGVFFSPDGTVFASTCQNEIRLWKGVALKGKKVEVGEAEDAGSGSGSDEASGFRWELEAELAANFSGYTTDVSEICFSPDSRSFVSACRDGSLRLWIIGADEPKQLTGLPDEFAYGLALSGDDSMIAAGGYAGAICWDLPTGLPVGMLPAQNYLDLAFDRDGAWIAGALDWDEPTESKQRIRTWALAGDAAQVSGVALEPRPSRFPEQELLVHCLASRPGGKKILASAGDDKLIRLWDEGGTQLGAPLSGHEDRVTSLAFDPTGRLLASAGKDGQVWIWELSDEGQLDSSERIYHAEDADIYSVAFDVKNSRGTRVAWGGAWEAQPYALIVWNLDSGRPEHVLAGHEAGIRSIAFHPTENLIVSGGEDAVVNLWDLEGAHARSWPIRRLDGFGGVVSGVAFSSDGRFLACSSFGVKPVLLWDFDSLRPIDFDRYIGDPLAQGGSSWLALDEGNRGIRWNASTNNLYNELSFGYVNVREGSHIELLQRSMIDPANRGAEDTLASASLFGHYLYSRNWGSALAVSEQLRSNGDSELADRLQKMLLGQLEAEVAEEPEGSAIGVQSLLLVP